MKTIMISALTLAIGVAVGSVATQQGLLSEIMPMSSAQAKLSAHSEHSGDSDVVTEKTAKDKAEPSVNKEPLYWVAPMDPNYRRDKPGKSPMGMDLVPVYADGNKDEKAGTVKISPVVENNLGVRTAKVAFDPLISEVNTVGYLSVDEDSQWQLNSRVAGWVEKLYIKSAGESVKKGQPLLRLYSPELVKAQEELINALRMSQNQNQNLISSAKRRLQALGMDQAQINDLVRKRKVEQEVIFYARQDGYLSQLNIREGAYISPAKTLLEVVSLDTVWLKAELFESQSSLVQVGSKAEIRLDAYPGERWQGEVDFIYPELDAKNRTVTVRLRFENPDQQLKPNMFAQVSLMSDAPAPSLLIPREALIRSGSMERVVLALGEGKYRSVRVEAGRESGTQIEILDGLMPGQTVVTSAQFMLDSESSLTADFSRMEFGSQAMGRAGMNHGGMNHGQMNHEGMDHSSMGQGGMDHSGMNHGQMNHEGMDHSSMGQGGMDHSGMNHGQMNHEGMDHSSMGKGKMNHSMMSQQPLELPEPTKADDDLDWLDLDDEEAGQ